jgi:hypothetical protein
LSISELSGTYTGGGSAGTESGKAPKDLGGLPSGGAPVFAPPSGSDSTGATPGTYSVEPFNPGQSAAQALQESEGGLAGLKNALFGVSTPDATGHHGGVLGDIPLVGDATRFASETTANALNTAGFAGKSALDAVGGALEHIDMPGEGKTIEAKFNAMPDSPEKQAALEQIAKDPGAQHHFMAHAMADYNKAQRAEGNFADGAPDFTTNAWRDWGSAAEAVDNLIGTLGLLPRLAERPFSGMSTPGQDGMNRLQAIMAVGSGQTNFNEDKGLLGTGVLAGEQTHGGLNHIEAIVYNKVSTHEWTDSQALDFLTANSSGYSHSTIANVAGEVALDPMNLATLGAASITKVGTLGARLAEATAKGEEAVKIAETALDAAKVSGSAEEIATATAKVAEEQKALQITNAAYKAGGDVSRVNVLGHAARSEKATNLVRNIYKTYEPLQQLHVDKALKIARATVDPLGALSLGNPFRRQMMDLLSDDATKTVIGGYGDVAHASLVHDLADATDGAATPLADMFSEDLGTYAGNLTRRVIAREQRDSAVAGKTVGRLMKEDINTVIAGLGTKVPRSYEEAVLREASKFRIRTWDETALKNLASRLADNYGIKSVEEWGQWMADKGLNADKLSMLHAATYGRATKRLMAAVDDARKVGAGALTDKLGRIILINRTTLTKQGALGLVTKIEEAKGVDAKIELIREAQELYPELRGFTLDATAPLQSAERFTKELSRTSEAYPSQIIADELKDLPDDLRSLHTDETYTLGLAPEDEYKWGLVRHNTEAGGWAPIHDVWVDHVATGTATGYRSVGRLVETNVAGQPIIGAIGKRLGRGMDYIDAGVKIMGRRVTGAVIADAARQSFLQNATHEFGSVGITKKVAEDMMNALEDAVGAQDIVVRPSGFSTTQMWKAVEDIIPKSIRPADFGKRDLMDLVLKAYQGDMRFVGLTQAFSSRVKRVLAFNSNNASVLAEQVYPTLKYRLNAIFQAQEKVEPWVLNSLRGVTPARSVKSMNDADRATAVLLERMSQRSLISNADQEMAEYAGKILHGQNIAEMAQASNTSLGKMTKRLGVDWAALRDVKGVKQVNMLRTFRKGLGKDLRKTWESVEPGLFDDMYSEAVRKAGKGVGGLDEDEFAVSLMAEQMLGSGVHVTPAIEDRVGAIARQFTKADFKAAVAPGTWMRPQTLGELSSLGMDDMAELLAFPVGRAGAVTKTEADLRAGIAAGKLTVEDVQQGLRRFNADPDYIARVTSALNFSWTGFWSQVGHDFGMETKALARYQDLIANAAEMRNMTPVDYLSQVLIPGIGHGSQDAVIGHLGQIRDIIGKDGEVTDRFPELAKLNVVDKIGGTEDEFVGQLASIFTAHLDPSAKRALLIQFRPELEARLSDALDLNMETVNRLWTPEMDSELARHILGEINAPAENLGDLYEAGLLRTAADFDRVDPKIAMNAVRPDGGVVTAPVTGLIGDGLRAADPEIQKQVFRSLGTLRGEFPNVPLHHVDIVDEARMGDFLLAEDDAASTAAVVVESGKGGSVMMLNKKFFGADHEAAWSGEAQSVENFPRQQFVGASADMPRETFLGAPKATGYGPAQTVEHEMGHVVDEHVKARIKDILAAKRGKTKEGRMLLRYNKFRDVFEGSSAHRSLSEYAHASDNEMMAELVGLASRPTWREDARAIDAATKDSAAAFKAGTGPQVAAVPVLAKDINDSYDAVKFVDYIDQVYGPGHGQSDLLDFAQELKHAADSGEDLRPYLVDIRKDAKIIENRVKAAFPDADVPTFGVQAALPEDLAKGPQTVEAAAEQVRTILQDAGVYKPRPVNPDFVAGADGIMPVVKQNPDVIRATQMFGKWTHGVMAEHIRNGASASQAATMEKIAGIPTHMAVPYNYTEHKLMDTAIQAMKAKENDAHTLQYYSRGRTMLERSINHPMFGIYPSSYMWGKIMPEMIRFMAKEPFGVRTGAAAYSYMDVQRSVALQREFDPGLDKKIEDLGHSPAIFAAGYMMPSWPWEASAAFPGYVREFAQEGLDMQSRVTHGGVVATKASGNGLNVQQVGQKAVDVVNPIKFIDRAILQPVKELNPISRPLGSGDDAQPYFLSPDSGPVAGAELGDPLSNAMSSLREILGG